MISWESILCYYYYNLHHVGLSSFQTSMVPRVAFVGPFLEQVVAFLNSSTKVFEFMLSGIRKYVTKVFLSVIRNYVTIVILFGIKNYKYHVGIIWYQELFMKYTIDALANAQLCTSLNIQKS